MATLCILTTLPPLARAELPGFTLVGENWTYVADGQSTVTGILVKPEGEGPFPAVIISHGKGGSATGFSLPKAREMATWGMVGIGPLYTHGAGDPDFGNTAQEGARTENLRRAALCLTILASLPDVDNRRIALYGNSMGAFVTIACAAEHADRIQAAAITAGGIVDSGDWPAPTAEEAAPGRAPMLILHGTDDTTVPPARSADLETLYRDNGVPVSRVLYDGIGHNLHQVEAQDVYTRIRNWFDIHHTLAVAPPRDRPRGIFVLDSLAGAPYGNATLRDANIRNYPFVSGYVLRMGWDFVETDRGEYDFTIIDNILAKLPARQKLSLILVPQEPAYIATEDGVTTWTDLDRSGNPIVRAVPWDPFLRERRRAFLAALAAHQTDEIALADRSEFDAIDPYLPGGHTGIRDPNTAHLRDLPGYTRAALLEAIRDELRTLTNLFPKQYVQIGFWGVTDTEGGTAAWQEIREALLTEFDGVFRPQVGFFMENLAASRPAEGTDPLTGYPTTAFGAPLYESRNVTWTAFQALTSWRAPFTGAEKVANATPADGMLYALDTFGCTYFELYVNDIDYTIWHPLFEEWHARLAAPATRATAAWLLR